MEFKYDAEQPDELSINIGDVIKNVIMSEGGWWEGELNGKKGMFPDNFVKVCNQLAVFRDLWQGLYNFFHTSQAVAMMTRPRGYKKNFMLNSAEHEIFPAHKC